MSRSMIRYILTEGRVRLSIALLICGVVAGIWSEGIAVAGQVNPPAESAEAWAPMLSNDADTGEQPTPVSVRPFEWIIAAIGAIVVWIFFASGWHRLQRVPRRPHPISPVTGFLLLLILLLAGIIGAVAARTVFSLGADLSEEANPLRAYALLVLGSHLAQGLVLIGLAMSLLRQSRRPMHETRPRAVSAFMLGLGGFLLCWPVVLLVAIIASSMTVFITGRPIEPIAHETLALFRDHPLDGWMALLIVLVVLAAPIIEEVMYRGIVQESLGQLGLSRWTAIVLTSVFFAAMHLPTIKPHALATLFVLSLGFGWIYEKTGRLAAPIAMHMAFNAANVALVMIMM